MLINKKGEVKIADFGVSGKMIDTYGVKHTFTGECRGVKRGVVVGW
jgi:hypothetical protein